MPRDGADVGDADGGRLVRLRPGTARESGAPEDVRLPSEFDYTQQAMLYLPQRMPDPRSPEFAAAAAREVVRDR